MARTIKIFSSIDQLAHFFAELIITKIEEKPENSFLSLVLSGGSTPRLIFKNLAVNFKKRIDWGRVQIFWGDERCVSPDNEDSNYKMAKESLLDNVPIAFENIYRIKGESDPEKEVKNYEETIKKNVQIKGQIPGFDIVMLGLGDDGHTASIFPGSLDLFEIDDLFAPTRNPYTGQKRITATGKMINNANTILFFVTGRSKSEILGRILEKKAGWEKLPASGIEPLNGEVFWLLDEEAASELSM